MFQAGELRNGSIFVYNEQPYKVMTFKHTHMGRGSADVRLKIKGLIKGDVLQVVFSPDERFEEADLAKKKMQYLYKEDENYIFMDPISYNQVELNKETMGDDSDFLKDGETYDLLYWGEKPLSIMIPPKIDVEVLECDPGVKGNSAANMYKSAVVTGNIQVRVPLFINQGEKIKIDTVNREYVERAK